MVTAIRCSPLQVHAERGVEVEQLSRGEETRVLYAIGAGYILPAQTGPGGNVREALDTRARRRRGKRHRPGRVTTGGARCSRQPHPLPFLKCDNFLLGKTEAEARAQGATVA